MKKAIAMLLALVLCLTPAAVAVAAEAEREGGYVLMNVPYAEFYENEADNASGLDAVTSATLMKPRTYALAGGSYHVDPEGTDISGVVFPVYVSDLSVLSSLGGEEITDESEVEITVTNRGEENTTLYSGRDALFEAPDYSWYVLEEEPAVYKTMNEDGSFSALEGGEPDELEGNASFVYDRHADVVIKVEGLEDVLENQAVSGIVLTTDGGQKIGLQHIANIWRGSEIGFSLESAEYAALAGSRIDSITYITTEGVYVIDVDLAVPDDELLPKLNGTYIELFPEFAKDDYKEFWMECIHEYLDDDAAAEAAYAMLTDTYMGTLYGEDAVKAYADDPESMLFDCFFINDLAKLTVNGDVFSGVDADGNELFSNVYHYVGSRPVTFFGEEIGTALRLYKTEEEDAGNFTWFAFSDDNLADTQHIEFRYGATDIGITDYSEGDYAYWLASGIADGYKDSLIQSCIRLFVDENLGESDEEAADTVSDAVPIATAEDLAAIADNLSGDYVLTADIDLEGAEWTPIGTFIPAGESGEEAELPDAEYAFTGTFDGNGHTISNLVIAQPEGYALGLFGCIADAKVGNFTIENATVDGAMMIAAGVGYSYSSEVYEITLRSADITAYETELSSEGMIAGVVGAGMSSTVTDCVAEDVNVTIPDNTANAGLVGGGLELCDVSGCTASGTVTAGNDCYGLGGVIGCAFGANSLEDCLANRVTITAGDNAYLVGGVVGYTGGYEDEEYGVPVTNVTGCASARVKIVTGEAPSAVGAIVGGGFYFEEVAQSYGGAYEKPTVFIMEDCDPATVNGEPAPLTGEI